MHQIITINYNRRLYRVAQQHFSALPCTS